MSTTPTIRTISPATNEVVCEVKATSPAEARAAAVAAEKVFPAWSGKSLADRRAVVVRALALIQERKMELGRELSQQMGRPVAFSHREIETMQKRASYLLDIAEEALADLPGRAEPGFKRWIKKMPVGPVLIVFAWNVCAITDR